jgi:murein tripeptide amidase MpaA
MLLPPLLAASVSVSDSFDGGNIEAEDMVTDSNLVKLYIKPDVYSELEQKSHFQSFAFRSTVSDLAPGAAIKVTYCIENAGQASFEKAWDSSATCYTTSIEDTNSWKRKTDTRYENGKLVWDHVHERNGSVYFSYFPLYTYPQHLELISKCAASANVKSLGKTIDGREIDCVVAGTGERVAWIIHRQHPGESMSEYFAEGLLTRLLGIDNDGHVDGLVRRLLQDYTFYIVPNMCPDGAVRGHLRTNAVGANLNREWFDTPDYPAPTLKNSPEVFHVLNTMKETGMDLFLDVHGDEVLPFNFLSGSEETVHWGPRLKALHGAFLASYQRSNPDMQSEIGYPSPPPGRASKNIGTNAIANRFNCLAATLEMPFQDCWTNPDPERGWSPSRSRQLGASLLDAMTYIHPYLRAPGPFWEDLPANDAYIRPRNDYENASGATSTNGEVSNASASKSKESRRKKKKSRPSDINRDGRNDNSRREPNTQRNGRDGNSSRQSNMNQDDRGGNSVKQPNMSMDGSDGQDGSDGRTPVQPNPNQDEQEVRMPMQPDPNQEVRMPMQPNPNQGQNARMPGQPNMNQGRDVRMPGQPNMNQGQNARMPGQPNMNQGQNARMPSQRNMDPGHNERFSFSRRSNSNQDVRDDRMPGQPFSDRNGPNGGFSDQSNVNWGRQDERHFRDGNMPLQGNGQGGVRWQPGMEPDGKYPAQSWLPDPKPAEPEPVKSRGPGSRGEEDGQFGDPPVNSRGPGSRGEENGQFGDPPANSRGPGPRREDDGQFGGPPWQPPNQEAGGQRTHDSWGAVVPRPDDGQNGGPPLQANGPPDGPPNGPPPNGQFENYPGPSRAEGGGSFDGRPSQPNGPAGGFDTPRERGGGNYEGRQRQPGPTNSRGPGPRQRGNGNFDDRQRHPNGPGAGGGRFDDTNVRGPGGGGGRFDNTNAQGPGFGNFDDRQRQPHSGGQGFGANNSRGPGPRERGNGNFEVFPRQPNGPADTRGGGNFEGRQRQPDGPARGGGFGATNSRGQASRAEGGETRQWQPNRPPNGSTGGQSGNFSGPMSQGPGNGARLWKPDGGGVGRTPAESSSWESSVQGYGPDPVVWRQSNNAEGGSQDGFNSWEYKIDTDSDDLPWQS